MSIISKIVPIGISAYTLALQKSEKIKTVFNHSLTNKSSIMDDFCHYVNLIHNGELFNILNSQWLTKHNINKLEYTNLTKLEYIELLSQAIINYCMVTNEKQNINLYVFNPNYFTSKLLLNTNQIIKNNEYNTILDSLNFDINLTNKIYIKYKQSPIDALIKLVEWYRLNIEAIKTNNQGTIQLSPLKLEALFIDSILNYMFSNGLMYFNSPLWQQYKEHLANYYHINIDCNNNQLAQARPIDYEHKQVKINSIIQGGYL